MYAKLTWHKNKLFEFPHSGATMFEHAKLQVQIKMNQERKSPRLCFVVILTSHPSLPSLPPAFAQFSLHIICLGVFPPCCPYPTLTSSLLLDAQIHRFVIPLCALCLNFLVSSMLPLALLTSEVPIFQLFKCVTPLQFSVLNNSLLHHITHLLGLQCYQKVSQLSAENMNYVMASMIF